MLLHYSQTQEVEWTHQFEHIRACPLCCSKWLLTTLESEYLGYEHEEEIRGFFCSNCGYWEILGQEWGQQDYKEDERFFESRLKNFNVLPEFYNQIADLTRKIKKQTILI